MKNLEIKDIHDDEIEITIEMVDRLMNPATAEEMNDPDYVVN